jgi:hypothetical protein
MDGDQAGVTWHARCGYGMRRGHVDGCGRGKAIGKMQVEEFMGFEVCEPGGGTQGLGKIMVGMTRGYDMAARDSYVMRFRGFWVSGIHGAEVHMYPELPILRFAMSSASIS